MKSWFIDKAIYTLEREKREKAKELAWQERQRKYKENSKEREL